MESIKELYKIGYGPSSSHTMGPRKAAELFKAKYPDATSYRVTLYGSLAATGKGHLTDKAIIAELAPKAVEIIWKPDEIPAFHTNGMLYEALSQEGAVTGSKMIYSIGGGSLSLGPEETSADKYPDVYPLNCMTDIKRYVKTHGMRFWEYVEECEGPQIWDYLSEIWDRMCLTVEEGLKDDSVLPGPMHVRSKAKQHFVRATSLKDPLQTRSMIAAYALATSEQNARGGLVVTAPTCGSCGVVPGCLYHLYKRHNIEKDDILKALATAGLFGNVIKRNASVSGAEVGCQGEVGSACVMAAVAVNQIFGGSINQVEAAGEMAMEHNLGLTCDPLCGQVQIPCIERNAVAALRAMDVSLYTLMEDGAHLISFDNVVETMKTTGHDIPSPYKETSMGGLANYAKIRD